MRRISRALDGTAVYLLLGIQGNSVEDNRSISNYCACFIDLLGQKDALKGQGVLPVFENEEHEKEFYKVVSESVGTIEKLQMQAEEFRQKSTSTYSIRDQLSSGEQELYDEMKKATAKQQRWSDGLVFYCSLENRTIKCPMNAMYEIFLLSGILCFLGLANKKPIRGAIEISWGVELHDNELYGAVVANSYELESKVAQYPRIVIGQETINFLNSYLAEPEDVEDKLFSYNRNLAQTCLNMTAIDQDGFYVLNYLGNEFTQNVTHNVSKELYKLAFSFICEQLEFHRSNRNTKLALRYTWLKGYFSNNSELHA